MNKNAVKVLLVDDDREDYMLVRRYLEKVRAGSFDLEWASGFDEAL